MQWSRRAALTLPILAAARAVGAQGTFPMRPVRLIVPFPPGGPTDIMARFVAQGMEPGLGQPVVVENRAGATGAIGSQAVAQAPPDGYNLVMGTLGSHTIGPLLSRTPPYDPRADFSPVALLAIVPNILMVNPDVPVRTARELVELLRREPGKHNYGSAGIGSPLHLSGVLLDLTAQVQTVHVPYRGSAPALQDLRAGRLTFMFDATPTALPLVTSGGARALAVTGPKRISALPDVPTMEEAGVGPFESYTWNALFAAPRTPPAIIDRLSRAAIAAVERPDIRRRMEDLGAEVVGSGPDALRQLVVSEVAKWTPVVEASGARES